MKCFRSSSFEKLVGDGVVNAGFGDFVLSSFAV